MHYVLFKTIQDKTGYSAHEEVCTQFTLYFVKLIETEWRIYASVK